MIDLSEVSTSDRPKRMLIGVPFFLLVVLALPLLALLVPAIVIASLVLRANPSDALGALWSVLLAIRGSHVEVAQRNHSVLVHFP
jgi:hypothetical protein